MEDEVTNQRQENVENISSSENTGNIEQNTI